jgi:hypothetical protein
MNRREIIAIVMAVLLVGILAWVLTQGLERVMRRPVETAQEEVAAPPPATPQRHITATLFHASSDGQYLVAAQHEVPFGEGPVEQGRQIVLAQITTAAAAPLVAAVPPGTTLRSFYLSDRGEAFVDLGPEILTAHPGGTAAELLTVYAIVNAVAANLPAAARVQLLVDGKEVDTLKGHVDLRRPLRRNDALVRLE